MFKKLEDNLDKVKIAALVIGLCAFGIFSLITQCTDQKSGNHKNDDLNKSWLFTQEQFDKNFSAKNLINGIENECKDVIFSGNNDIDKLNNLLRSSYLSNKYIIPPRNYRESDKKQLIRMYEIAGVEMSFFTGSDDQFVINAEKYGYNNITEEEQEKLIMLNRAIIEENFSKLCPRRSVFLKKKENKQ